MEAVEKPLILSVLSWHVQYSPLGSPCLFLSVVQYQNQQYERNHTSEIISTQLIVPNTATIWYNCHFTISIHSNSNQQLVEQTFL